MSRSLMFVLALVGAFSSAATADPAPTKPVSPLYETLGSVVAVITKSGKLKLVKMEKFESRTWTVRPGLVPNATNLIVVVVSGKATKATAMLLRSGKELKKAAGNVQRSANAVLMPFDVAVGSVTDANTFTVTFENPTAELAFLLVFQDLESR